MRCAGTSNPLLLVEKNGGIATVCLNRPEARNALSLDLRAALVETFASLHADADVGVVILTGAGTAFCSGFDLGELSGSDGHDDDVPAAITRPDVIAAMASCDRPIIGAINGPAVTGGFELALACDILIASCAARFADTHARVGALPCWGLSQKLSRTIGSYRAKELSLTGNYLSADDAAAWGLVSRVVSPAALMPTCRALAADILGCVPGVVRELKRVIDAGYRTTLQDGLALEASAARAVASGISADAIALRRSDLQRRGREQAS